jgi:multidrug efflux pump subunit AcrA (membrane-fusion protein)
MRRFFWLFGGLLLVGSLVGAYAVSHTPGSQGKPLRSEPVAEDYVYAQGHVTVKNGVVDMYPRQPGLVVKIAAENEVIDEQGTVLLQIDDALAQHDLKLAQDELTLAQTQLDLAEIEVTRYPFKVDALQAVIQGLLHQHEAAVAQARIHEKNLRTDLAVTKDNQIVLKEGPAALKSQVEAKQAELKELEAAKQVPHIQVRQAQATLKLKQDTVAKANEALKLYQVRAPSKGVVLRVLTNEGETLGTSPRTAALQFRPAGPLYVRAEVLQEWGYLVKKGQSVIIEDETSQDHTWTGEVHTVSQWYAPMRSQTIEPMRMNDVRTLDCLIEITGSEDGLYPGQRVRAKILK